MAPRATKKKATGPKVTIPEGVNEFYANSLNVLTSTWDFILLFGSTELPASVGQAGTSVASEVRVDAAVRMSPQHAKASLRVLERTVQQWEKRYGEITLPVELA